MKTRIDQRFRTWKFESSVQKTEIAKVAGDDVPCRTGGAGEVDDFEPDGISSDKTM